MPYRSTVELTEVTGQLVLRCANKTQLGRNSCLQFVLLAPFFSIFIHLFESQYYCSCDCGSNICPLDVIINCERDNSNPLIHNSNAMLYLWFDLSSSLLYVYRERLFVTSVHSKTHKSCICYVVQDEYVTLVSSRMIWLEHLIMIYYKECHVNHRHS